MVINHGYLVAKISKLIETNVKHIIENLIHPRIIENDK